MLGLSRPCSTRYSEVFRYYVGGAGRQRGEQGPTPSKERADVAYLPGPLEVSRLSRDERIGYGCGFALG